MHASATRLADIMTRRVLSISPSSKLEDAFELMRGAGIHHLVVMRAGRVVGIVSDCDLERARSVSYMTGDDVWRVEEMMSRRVVIGSPEMTVRDAARLMRSHAIGCLPVVDGKQLVGIITTSDLLALLAEMPQRITAPRMQRRWVCATKTGEPSSELEPGLPSRS
jgi:acetoin utilization protein AcuB